MFKSAICRTYVCIVIVYASAHILYGFISQVVKFSDGDDNVLTRKRLVQETTVGTLGVNETGKTLSPQYKEKSRVSGNVEYPSHRCGTIDPNKPHQTLLSKHCCLVKEIMENEFEIIQCKCIRIQLFL